MSQRKGFTLVETLMVVVILGALVLIAYPKVSAGMLQSNLRSSRTTTANMLAKARIAAMQSNRSTWIKFQGNRVWVIARPRRKPPLTEQVDTIGAVQDLMALYGSTVSFPGDSIQYDPRGWASGFATDSVVTISHGGKYQDIMLDGLGRVRK